MSLLARRLAELMEHTSGNTSQALEPGSKRPGRQSILIAGPVNGATGAEKIRSALPAGLRQQRQPGRGRLRTASEIPGAESPVVAPFSVSAIRAGGCADLTKPWGLPAAAGLELGQASTLSFTGPGSLERHDGLTTLRAVTLPRQSVGPCQAASPAASHAGLPGAHAAPPAGVLGEASVVTPAAARSSEAARRR